MTDEGIRLAKRVVETVACSRADAERYIAGGWVSVDGDVIDDPATRVLPAQQVVLLPGATAEEPQPVTILLHKPAGLHGKAALDSLQADTLFQAEMGPRFLKRHLTRLTPAMPLEYVAEVSGAIVEDGLARLNAAGRPNAPIKASWQSEARLRFAAKGIVPGQIEALCAKVGLQVTALRRLRIGRLALSGLPVGQWRYLRDTEKF
jgi:23S rRNA pseudouridine2604 synthase